MGRLQYVLHNAQTSKVAPLEPEVECPAVEHCERRQRFHKLVIGSNPVFHYSRC
jgi:hypothetical protein